MPVLRRAAAFVALALTAGAGPRVQAQDAPTLAVVDGERIDGDAFRSRYADLLLRSGLRDDPRLRRRVLSDLVAERLLVHEAHAIGLPATDAWRREEARERRRLLLAYYAERVLFEPIAVTEAERDEAFLRTRTTVTARHLYARTREGAERLRARLAAGETFEALAREVFGDSALATSGGLLPPFSFDEMDAAFEDAAFTLPIGQVSAPVRTEQGYSVIRVERRDVLPLAASGDYARVVDRLDAYVRTRKRQAARADALARREAEMAARLTPAGVAALARRAGTLTQLDGASDAEVRRAVAAAGSDASLAVVSFTSGGRRVTWTAADVLRQAAFASDRTRARLASADDVAAFVRALALQQTLVDEAAARGLDREATYTRAVAEAMDQTAVRLRREALARPNAPPDSVRAEYARLAPDLVRPARVDVSEIVVADEATARRLRADLDRGAAFDALARAHSLRRGSAGQGGRLGWATADQLGLIAPAVIDAAPGTVVGPLAVGDRWVLVRVHAREAARPMTLDEARPLLVDRVGRRIGTRAFDAHLARLRDRAAIVFDGEALSALPLAAPRPAPASSASR